MQLYDMVIIGGGPAGLSAAYYLTANNIKVCLFDRGQHYTKRLNKATPFDIANGLGGAGLLYDGKYSFSPSGSYFWQNVDPQIAERSYEVVKKFGSCSGINFPEWKEEWMSPQTISEGEKYYETMYFSQESQLNLVRYLSEQPFKISLNTEVSSVKKMKDGYIIETADGSEIFTHGVLIATGKHGTCLLSHEDFTYDKSFKLEVGIRVECDTLAFIPKNNRAVDYKLIKRIDEKTHVRTFCCCKEGKVLSSFSGKYPSVNGEKVLDYNRSNVGILLRTEAEQGVYADEIQQLLQNKKPLFKMSLIDFLSYQSVIIGKSSDKAIKDFVGAIVDLSRHETLESAIIHGPEIEYIGDYPVFDSATLKIPNESIWVAGDVSGKYRGLLVALVSGVYAAQNILGRS